MMECGSQCILCDYPVHFDTYAGCSHGCAYCFVTRARKTNLQDIRFRQSIRPLKEFIEGKRNRSLTWCDWRIPVHWGGVSDPFQPAEAEHGISLKAMQMLKDTGYPYIVSTKGRLIGTNSYLKALDGARAVVQVSMVSPQYDRIEPGAPPFSERMAMLEDISQHAVRTIVRIQPYMRETLRDVLDAIQLYADAGVHGIIIEGLKALTKKSGMVKLGNDFVYPLQQIEHDFKRIYAKAHEHGLRCYAGENRLRGRGLGDSLTCCGTDGLDDFIPNRANLNHILTGESDIFTPAMDAPGSGACMISLYQDAQGYARLRDGEPGGQSYRTALYEYIATHEDFVKKTMGLRS